MKRKKKFKFSSLQVRILASVFVVVLLLQAATTLSVYFLIERDLKSKRAVDVEESLDSVATSLSSKMIGAGEDQTVNPNYDSLRKLMRVIDEVYDELYPEFKDTIDNEGVLQEYLIRVNELRIQKTGLGMTLTGDTKTQLETTLSTILCPSNSKYLYVGSVDPETQNFVVSVGAFDYRDFGTQDTNSKVFQVAKSGYYFPWSLYQNKIDKSTIGTEKEGFIGFEYNDPIKKNISVSARRIHFKDNIVNGVDTTNYWVIAETDMSFFADQTKRFSLTFLYTSLASFVIVFICLALAMQFIFIRKINRLSDTAEDAVGKLKEGNATNNFTLSTARHPDEIDNLNDNLAYFEQEILTYMGEREATIQKEERNRAELAYSAEIQLSSLPDKPVDDNAIAIYPRIKLAKDVGGDLYDYFYIDDHRFLFLIGDVSGKGVPAALFMMQSIAKIKAKLSDKGEFHLGEEIKAINNAISSSNPMSLFITFFIGLVDLSKNVLTYVNCGHEEAFYRHNGVYKMLEGPSNLPLGASEGFEFEMVTLPLSPGDALFLYTDGVSEAENIKGEFFGKENIGVALNDMASLPSPLLVDKMLAMVSDYQKGKEQSDDICMLSLAFRPNPHVYVDNKLENLDKAQAFITETLKDVPNAEAISYVSLVIDELLTNVILYAYPESEGKVFFGLTVDKEKRLIMGTLVDCGIPFNPLEKEKNEDITNVPGGLGIHISKEVLDSLDYRYEMGHNVLTFTKKY